MARPTSGPVRCVNLDRCHAPLEKVIEHAGNLCRISNRPADVKMYRRRAVQQRAARKDTGTRRGMSRREARNQGCRHNLIAGAADTGYSGPQGTTTARLRHQ